MSSEIKKSEQNPRLIERVLFDSMANNWECRINRMHTSYVLNTVDEDSEEYSSVENIFEETARGLTITKLERVENPYLLGIYLLKKEKMQEEYGFVNEESLFHGTEIEYIDSICTDNFDWRRSGNSTGHKFGMGVSFAPEVSYARHYGNEIMILSKVLVQNKCFGDCSTEIPPESYDTTTNGRNTVFVKYEDDDFYPQYIIHYS